MSGDYRGTPQGRSVVDVTPVRLPPIEDTSHHPGRLGSFIPREFGPKRRFDDHDRMGVLGLGLQIMYYLAAIAAVALR